MISLDIMQRLLLNLVQIQCQLFWNILKCFSVVGFHPTGILDFVDEEDEYTTPKFEPAVDEDEKLDEWTQTLIDDCEWPFPKDRPSEGPKAEPWHGVSPSVAMQWTVKELQKGPMTVESVTNICPVCKIDNETMKNNKCWDNNCPKGNDAN